ncbi:MAG TPA: 1-deoxy-D-xylulose-5-phosphate reductoisomerase, partial [Bacillales bacterium]|nr:1-deoxy-D-xylulose-5-phosphate reductoisomerase [Bacillales bacterium]
MKKISLLGATGSVGRQTLEVLALHPDQFSLVAMSFGKNVASALEIIHTFQPRLVSAQTKEIRDEIAPQVPDEVKLVYGVEGLIEVAAFPESNFVLNAVLGSVG